MNLMRLKNYLYLYLQQTVLVWLLNSQWLQQNSSTKDCHRLTSDMEPKDCLTGMLLQILMFIFPTITPKMKKSLLLNTFVKLIIALNFQKELQSNCLKIWLNIMRPLSLLIKDSLSAISLMFLKLDLWWHTISKMDTILNLTMIKEEILRPSKFKLLTTIKQQPTTKSSNFNQDLFLLHPLLLNHQKG